MSLYRWSGAIGSVVLLGAALAACGSDGSGGTGGAGGSAGAAGSGGGNGSLPDVNGCTFATAENHASEANATITSQGFTYVPPCVIIGAGATVTFNSDFSSHPLIGGTVEGSTLVQDPASPIVATGTGSTATFTFPSTGAYGFYCDFHALSGMKGAVYVVP